MRLVEINQLLSTLLADSSNNFFTQTERLQAINGACTFINGELRILQSVAEIPVSPTDRKIPLPADFVSLGRGVDWVEGNLTIRLDHAVPMQLGSGWASEASGSPSRYVMEGGNIYLYPKPSKPGVVQLSYIVMPNPLLEDDDVPFYGDPRTQAYHEMIAYYAAWQLTMKDRDFEAAQQFMAYFQARMIDLKENMRHAGGPLQPVWSDTYAVV